MSLSKPLSRLLCAALALCTLGGAAVSCKTAETVPSSSVTASDAKTPAELISGRIPCLDRQVIAGDETDAASYGIDMTNFEDDGYVIKNVADTVFIFGKTDAALTAAANKFVNMYNAGAVEDVIYHEGYRIERLEIFGTDISEYVIEYPAEDNSYSHIAYAVSELVRLVKQATGVTLTTHVGDSGAEHVIEFRQVNDDALRFDGFRYFDENGTLVFEGSSSRYGCLTAVYRFLQNECGWDELIAGESLLNESDYINIPTGINKTEVPAFDHYAGIQIRESLKNDQRLYSGYGIISHACHGIQTYNFFMMNDPLEMPCFTDEELYEICAYNVEKYIEARYGNPSFLAVDLATPDSNAFCLCENCLEIFMEEGKTHSAAIVLFANRISEEMNEKYPGLLYQIFAYNDTNKPPKTVRPNDMVHITYCFDIICNNHPLDGSGCEGRENYFGRKNSDFAEWFEEWSRITKNIYVWYYSLDTNFHDFTVIDTIYKDFTYLAKHGVTGIAFQSTECGLGMKRIHRQLTYNLNWDIDMTEEEYYALYERLLEKEYGPGWRLIAEYERIMQESQDRLGCFTGWGWSNPVHMNNKIYDTFYYSTEYDYIVEILDRAIAMAETPSHIRRCEMLMISALYKGCYSEYFIAYENEDTDRIAVLSERYDRAMELMRKYGFDLSGETGKYITVDLKVCEFRHASIEDAAWIDWYVKWDELCPGHEKPEPEEYVGLERPALPYF